MEPNPITYFSRRPKAGTRRAFTLIDLLIVIAAIAMLSALLLPSLARAKSKDNQAACLSNLRQLQVAWNDYVAEHNGLMPANDSGTRNWVQGNAQTSANIADLQSGLLYPYVRDVGAYRCPADNSVLPDTDMPKIRSYSLNVFLKGAANIYYTNMTKESDMVSNSPAVTFGFCDENEVGIDDGTFGSFRDPRTQWISVPSDRHDQSGCFTFCDGHCETWHWRAPKIFQRYPANVTGPDDLYDLRRLQTVLGDIL